MILSPILDLKQMSLNFYLKVFHLHFRFRKMLKCVKFVVYFQIVLGLQCHQRGVGATKTAKSTKKTTRGTQTSALAARATVVSVYLFCLLILVDL